MAQAPKARLGSTGLSTDSLVYQQDLGRGHKL